MGPRPPRIVIFEILMPFLDFSLKITSKSMIKKMGIDHLASEIDYQKYPLFDHFSDFCPFLGPRPPSTRIFEILMLFFGILIKNYIRIS